MITTKTALIAAMKAAPGCKLHGRTGARPASHWKYKLVGADNKDIDTVSAPLVDRCSTSGDLRCLRSDWLSSAYRLSSIHRTEA